MVAALADERYISLTTFKRDGTPVSTPVWVVTDDGERLLVWSAVRTWKVRRLRRDPRVFVAASNFRGKERGRRIPGEARVVADPGIDQLLRRKYGWQKRVLDRINARGDTAWATIEISDSSSTLAFRQADSGGKARVRAPSLPLGRRKSARFARMMTFDGRFRFEP